MVRFSVIAAKAVRDPRVTDSQLRTLAIVGMFTDENGFCYPSLKTIAEIKGVSKQAISKDIAELEKFGYLKRIPRYKGKARLSNLLQVRLDFPPDENTQAIEDEQDDGGDTLTPEANTISTPEVNALSTPEVNTLSTSEVDTLLTSRVDVNINNPINNPINDDGVAEKVGSLDWLIAAGVSSEKARQILKREKKRSSTAALWEQLMGYNPLPWETNKDLRALLDFLVKRPEDEIRKFAAWSRQPYSPLNPAKARQFPRMVIELWPLAVTQTQEIKQGQGSLTALIRTKPPRAEV